PQHWLQPLFREVLSVFLFRLNEQSWPRHLGNDVGQRRLNEERLYQLGSDFEHDLIHSWISEAVEYFPLPAVQPQLAGDSRVLRGKMKVFLSPIRQAHPLQRYPCLLPL